MINECHDKGFPEGFLLINLTLTFSEFGNDWE